MAKPVIKKKSLESWILDAAYSIRCLEKPSGQIGKPTTILLALDDVMVALERDNLRLKGTLNNNYGRVFQYFLTQFASTEGKNGGQLGDISIYAEAA